MSSDPSSRGQNPRTPLKRISVSVGPQKSDLRSLFVPTPLHLRVQKYHRSQTIFRKRSRPHRDEPPTMTKTDPSRCVIDHGQIPVRRPSSIMATCFELAQTRRPSVSLHLSSLSSRTAQSAASKLSQLPTTQEVPVQTSQTSIDCAFKITRQALQLEKVAYSVWCLSAQDKIS
ncbi:hypothetical protein LTS15_006796 [Exophiala xenobiotica]|nr:hypothetical protein LTS15_006796 [Exophiala xenobiotica]